MDNTLENKAKFFAQYWGQMVAICTSYDHQELYRVNISHIQNISALELKPISSSSIEDAEELGKFVGLYNVKATNLDGKMIVVRDDSYAIIIDSEGCKMYYNNKIWHDDDIKIHQFFVSKGYALPWMGLSVEDQIEYGWIKLNK